MRLLSLLVPTLTALPFLSATTAAQSPLTTVFSPPASTAGVNSIYFDLTSSAPAVTITGMDLNLWGTGSVAIWTRAGTRSGNQSSSTGWTLHSSQPVTGALPGGPTPISFSPLLLGAGVHGIAIFASGGLQQRVSTILSAPTTFSTAELTLNTGESTAGQFSGPVTAGAVVNTSIRYLVGNLVGIPPHNGTTLTQTRGYNFTAATDFVIRQLALPPEAKQAGDTASYLVRVNGAVAYRSIGNAGAVTTNVSVRSGDVVDVMGNWSAPVIAIFSAHNSLTASVTSYSTSIQGVAHTLRRCGWSWDIGDPTWTPSGPGLYVIPATGPIGRVLMTTEPLVTASNTVLGQGCGRQFASIYEVMTPANFDLANKVVNLDPTNHGFSVNLIGSLLPVGSVGTPVTLALGDDTEVTVPFTTGSFLDWTGVTVASNGIVSKASGNPTFWQVAVSAMLNAPEAAFWAWHDYNPTSPGSGQIKVEQSPSLTTITWDGVHTFQDPTPTTLQFQLYVGGQVKIAFGNVSPNTASPHLIGYSPGGPNTDPGSFDFMSLFPFGTTYTNAPDAPAVTLSGLTRPIAGTSWNLQVDHVPGATVFGVDILGLSDPGILDLAAIGMPGCQQRASLDSLSFWIHGGGFTHSYSWQVPPLVLLGVEIYTASVAFSSQPMNPFGAVSSNGICGEIGTN